MVVIEMLYQMLTGLTLIRNPGIRLRSPKESNPQSET